MNELLVPHQRIIFALDVSTRSEAYKWCDLLSDKIGMVKIGLELFTSFGPDIFDAATGFNLNIMLDLKLHDIPNTVQRTVARLLLTNGIKLITVHASGGSEMITSHSVEWSPRIAAVTVLTSLDEEECKRIYGASPSLTALNMALRAYTAGARAFVCSGHEVKTLRDSLPEVTIIVPGVRPIHSDAHDQKRIVTPQEAVADGADFLVVGRYISQADNPIEACEIIAEGIHEGMRRRNTP